MVVDKPWAAVATALVGSWCKRAERYPLVIADIAIENGHRNSGFTDLPIENGDSP